MSSCNLCRQPHLTSVSRVPIWLFTIQYVAKQLVHSSAYTRTIDDKLCKMSTKFLVSFVFVHLTERMSSMGMPKKWQSPRRTTRQTICSHATETVITAVSTVLGVSHDSRPSCEQSSERLHDSDRSVSVVPLDGLTWYKSWKHFACGSYFSAIKYINNCIKEEDPHDLSTPDVRQAAKLLCPRYQ
jgi:hypothetical protein